MLDLYPDGGGALFPAAGPLSAAGAIACGSTPTAISVIVALRRAGGGAGATPRRWTSRSISTSSPASWSSPSPRLSLDLILGYGGHGQLRPCRLSRHRRLCGRHPRLSTASPTASSSSASRPACRRWSALFIGAISLRTTGVAFVMITLAFAQMLYFLAISLNLYGGDDGMSIASHSNFGRLVDLADPNDALLRRVRRARRLLSGARSGSSNRASAWCCAAPNRTRGA